MKRYLLKVLDEENNEVDTVEFIDNLTVEDAPNYVNFNGLVGLNRLTSEKYKGKLVICFFYPEEQELSYAEFIGEGEAYNMCSHRNKLDVAYQLGINLLKEIEVL